MSPSLGSGRRLRGLGAVSGDVADPLICLRPDSAGTAGTRGHEHDLHEAHDGELERIPERTITAAPSQ